jgi:hypothetical protein
MSSAIVRTPSKYYSGFNPLCVPGCALWLDAGDSSTLTLSGSNVTTWADKSGNGRNATGGVSPTFSNGEVVFNGSQFLSTNYTAAPSTETVFAVATITSTTSSRNFFIIAGTNTNERGYTVNLTSGVYTVNWDKVGVARYASTSGVQQSVRFLTSGLFTGTTATTGVNGGGQSTPTAVTFSGAGTTAIGAISSAVANTSWIGTISEIIIYNNTVSESQRQQVEGYLAWKWGLNPRSSSFLPTSISGCQLWMDAADSSTLTLSGTSVSQWRDKVSNVAFNTQGTLANITLTNRLNGLQSIYFNNSASDSVFMAGTFPNIPTGTAFYAFRASSQRTVAWRAFLAWRIVGVGGQFPAYGYLGNTTVNTVGPYTTSASPNGTPTQVLTPGLSYVISYSWNGTSTAVTTNGSPVVTGSQQPYSSSSTTCWIGSDGVHITLDYGEIILFNRILTDSERQQVEQYLARKWAIQTLISSHPYSSIVPVTRSFVPIDITGCTVWLDAADPSTLTLSGSNVILWADKSGNNNNATQATDARRPTYVNSNTVRFVRANSQFLSLPAGSIWSSNNPLSIFMVMAPTSTYFANVFLFQGVVSTNLAFGVYTTGTTFADYWQTVGSGSWGNMSVNVRTMISYVYTQNTNIFAYQDGSGGLLRNQAGYTISTANATIGAEVERSFFSDSDINEIIIYASTLTAFQRQQVEGYLARKWGLSGLVPSTHSLRTMLPATVSFNPLQISNCFLWYDAADTRTITSIGTTLTTWANKAGTTINLTPNGNATTTGNTINGLNYVNIPFGGELRFTAALNTQARSWFFVVRNNTPATNWAYNFLIYNAQSPTSGQDSVNIFRSGNSYTLYLQPYNTVRLSAAVPNPIGLINMYALINSAASTSLNAITINGTPTLSTSLIATSYNTSSLPYTINISNQTNYRTSMDVFEILFYTRALSITERQQVEGYLAWKWNLQGSLSSIVPSIPTQISNCVLWLDANDSSTFTLSGSNVSQWRDKSGNNNHMNQYSAGTAPSISTLNGYNTVLFNTASPTSSQTTEPFTNVKVLRGTNFMTTANTTVFLVATPLYVATDTKLIVNLKSRNATSWANLYDMALGTASTGTYVRTDTTTVTANSAYYQINTTSLTGFQINGTSVQFYRNGSVYNSGTLTLPMPASDEFQVFTLGAYVNTDQYDFVSKQGSRAHIHELIVYNGTLTITERRQVENYLANKWGISLLSRLPNTHAYRKISPI